MNALDVMRQRFRISNAPARLGPSLGSGLDVFGGCERRTAADDYRWDGMRRGQSPRQPVGLIQYTLDGHGVIDHAGRSLAIPAEHCMIAVIPSPHVYYLPAGAASWTFSWIMINHPYVVWRLAELIGRAGAVLPAAAGTDLPEAIFALMPAKPAARQDDAFSREAKLFDLLTAAGRAAHAMRHGGDDHERLLARVRQLVRSGQMARPNVDAIAAAFGMSRSNFSHHFRATTGLTPAAFVRDLRLERARDDVVGTDASLKSIAHTLGFADANHFGKVFSARFGFSPTALRRQTRGRFSAGL